MEERVWDFRKVGRLPAPGDNVAIATRRLEAGTRVSYRGSEFEISHTVLEGHRFAVEPIVDGDDLLSWGLRFGRATKEIAFGDYVCNEKILKVLAERHVDFELPSEPNFADAEIEPYVLDEESFRPGQQVPIYDEPRTFMGYRRGAGRGVGTRNYIVVMGVTSKLTGFVRAVELEMNGVADAYENVDGIVCVAHT
ncbi:MAG: UxaA family hydrolase, partial [Actinomycetota bacterium]|nr:UxaA family hydrolase [Actinomycetota bacterium]